MTCGVSETSRAWLSRMTNRREPHVFQPRNQPAVRIPVGVVEPLLEYAHGLLAKDVFDLLCVLVDVIGCKMRSVCKIQLPKTVIADDFAGAVPSLRGKGC